MKNIESQNPLEQKRLEEEQKKLEEKYCSLFNSEIWKKSCEDVVGFPRPFKTSDFQREYFIPDM